MIVRGRIAIAALSTLLAVPCTWAQRSGPDGWIEETNGKTLADDPGHSYLDPGSVHRGDDGLVYFNESNGVTKPEDAGRIGLMKDAYDCARNIKYMCVGTGDWRNDPKSEIHTSDDPALSIYRKYLCGEDMPTESTATKAESTSR